MFTDAGKQGLLGFSVPEEHGGPGVEDYRYNAILIEEVNRAGAAAAGIAFSLQNDVVLPYLTDMANEEQKVRWLPGCATGEIIPALAMTEPGTGWTSRASRPPRSATATTTSSTASRRSSRTGSTATCRRRRAQDRPEPGKHKGISLIGRRSRTPPGFERGRNLEKMGHARAGHQRAVLRGLRVPVANRLGVEGEGF